MSRNIENTLAGIKENGRDWKHTIHGVSNVLRAIELEYAKTDTDVAQINALMKTLGNKFKKVWNEDKATMGQTEALDWFLDEDVTWFLDEYGGFDEFRDEFNYRLNDLYDYADYNRVWVAP